MTAQDEQPGGAPDIMDPVTRAAYDRMMARMREELGLPEKTDAEEGSDDAE